LLSVVIPPCRGIDYPALSYLRSASRVRNHEFVGQLEWSEVSMDIVDFASVNCPVN